MLDEAEIRKEIARLEYEAIPIMPNWRTYM